MTTHSLTHLELRTIQMEYAVPLVRAMQKAFGEEAVNAVLAKHHRDELEAASKAPKSVVSMDALEAGAETYAADDALDYDVIRRDEEHFDMNVTRCGYAEMMEKLGARDLGQHLICNVDFTMAERMGLDLERTQTRMEGASHCDFRYRKKSAANEGSDDE